MKQITPSESIITEEYIPALPKPLESFANNAAYVATGALVRIISINHADNCLSFWAYWM